MVLTFFFLGGGRRARRPNILNDVHRVWVLLYFPNFIILIWCGKEVRGLLGEALGLRFMPLKFRCCIHLFYAKHELDYSI